jgi:hypothetical protein
VQHSLRYAANWSMLFPKRSGWSSTAQRLEIELRIEVGDDSVSVILNGIEALGITEPKANLSRSCRPRSWVRR